MKIAVCGGGSTYTPELLDGLIERAGSLGVDEVVLQDPDDARRTTVAGFCQRLVAARGSPFTVRETADRQDALDGAGCVILQLRVGGQQARHQDIQLGLKYGLIGQETTGVGGFAKALRTLPAVIEICSDIVKICPDAWVINFTNPSGLITSGIHRATGLEAIGLCNIPLNLRVEIGTLLGVAETEVDLDYVGLNHLSWVRRVLVDGKDRLPDLFKRLAEGPQEGLDLPEEVDYAPGFLEALGAIPSPYLRYYYRTAMMLERLRQKSRSRAEEVMEIEARLLEAYADPEVTTKPAALSERGGADYSRAATGLLEALVNNQREVHIVNVANHNTIPGLPPEAVVEIPCLINAYGAHPLDVGEVEPQLLALMQQIQAYEELTLRASIWQSRAAALLALTTHPLGPDADQAPALLDELLEINGLTLE